MASDYYVTMTAWHCETCEVWGVDPSEVARCWFCGSDEIVVDARPSFSKTHWNTSNVPPQRRPS